MSYYTLPSFNCNNIIFENSKTTSVSQTLVYYVNQCFNDLIKNDYFEFGKKYTHMLTLLKYKVDKDLDINFFNMIEINTITNLINNKSNVLIIDKNKKIIDDLIKYTTIFDITNTHFYNINNYEKYNCIFSNIMMKNKKDFLDNLKYIKINQKIKGNMVIKLEDTYSNYSINVIYILSLLYKKIVVIKPNSGNTFLFERYIVCKSFNKNAINILDKIYSSLYNINSENFSIENIPLFFLNKLDECNTIMGQQQIDCILFMYQCNFLKEKTEKLENFYKKLNYKCQQWIESNNINKNEFICNECFETHYNDDINEIIENIINSIDK